MLSRFATGTARRRSGQSNLSVPVDALESRELLTISFKFDYSLDNSNFFGQPGAKAALEQAARTLESKISDTLDPITPSGSNTWTANLFHPSTGQQITRNNLRIGQDEILVYAGARNLGGSLGTGGWGGFSWRGTQDWGDTVEFRGEAENGTDFAPWGGAVSFSTTRDWHFGLTVDGLESNEEDFLSVAVHELSHVLGFSIENPAYSRHVSGTTFRGPRSIGEYDGTGNVPLDPDRRHWREDILDNGRQTALDPDITTGSRELMTFLDFAGLDDIGWDVDRQTNDWGDAPSNRYPTNSSDNGARHNIKSGLFLGGYADAESNGQDSDDNDGLDDDDGVRFLDSLEANSTARVDITASDSGKVNAWIDFNLDGDWDDTGEHILDDVDVSAGKTRFTFDVPGNARSGASWARVRLNSSGNLQPMGGAADGEVEDHPVTVIDGVLAVDDSRDVRVGGTETIDVRANDLPGGQTQVLSFTDPDKGAVTLRGDGRLLFEADAGATGTTTFDYTIAQTQTKIIGGDAGDEFGRSMVTQGNTMIIGAHQDDTSGGTDAGSVHVYHRTGDDWTLSQTITAPDGEDGARFGFSVAIDGDTLVVGALLDSGAANRAGAAYIFDRSSETSNFTFTQKLTGTDTRAKDEFGNAISIDGNYLVVGSRFDDNRGRSSGSAEVFVRQGDTWVSQQHIIPDTLAQGDQFGAAVAISGTRMFIAARRDNHDNRVNAGSVYVFQRTGSTWNIQTQIFSPKIEKHAYFGLSLAVEGNRLVVGQPARERATRTGRVFVLDRNEGGTDNWGLVKQIDTENTTEGNRFGFSIALSGNQLIVGSPRANDGRTRAGEVTVYNRTAGGTDNWGLVRTLSEEDSGGGDEYGQAVGFSGDQILVTARREDEGGTNSGALYIDDLRTDIGRVTITIG